MNDYEVFEWIAEKIEELWGKVVDILGPHIIKMWFVLIVLIVLFAYCGGKQ